MNGTTMPNNRTFTTRFLHLLRTYSQPRMIVAMVSAAIAVKLIVDQITPATLTDLSWPKNNVRMISLAGVALWIIVAESGSTLASFAKNRKLEILTVFSGMIRPTTPLALAIFVGLYLPSPLTWLFCAIGYSLHRLTAAMQTSLSTRGEILHSLGFGSVRTNYQERETARITPALALVTLTAGALLLMRFGLNRTFLSEMPLIIAAGIAAAQFVARQPPNLARP